MRFGQLFENDLEAANLKKFLEVEPARRGQAGHGDGVSKEVSAAKVEHGDGWVTRSWGNAGHGEGPYIVHTKLVDGKVKHYDNYGSEWR